MTKENYQEQAEKLIRFVGACEDLNFSDAARRWWTSKDFTPGQQGLIRISAIAILEGRGM